MRYNLEKITESALKIETYAREALCRLHSHDDKSRGNFELVFHLFLDQIQVESQEILTEAQPMHAAESLK